MYYDLNVPWTPTTKDADLQSKIAFLAELGYNVLALTHTLIPDQTTNKLPLDISCPIPQTLPFPLPKGVRILRRLNLLLNDHTQNHRLKDLTLPTSGYDLIALRPVDDKTLSAACLSLDCDLISLDLSQRYHFHFQYKMFAFAIARGVHIELCYGPGLVGTSDQRKNLIQNAGSLIRVTRGRGLVMSSECGDVLAVRGPADVINLATIWGLGQERGVEAVTTEARKAVVNAAFKRSSYRGVIDVIYGGEKVEKKREGETSVKKGKQSHENKRKFAEMNVVANVGDKPLSNRQKKKIAKEAKAKASEASSEQVSEQDQTSEVQMIPKE